MAIKSFNISEDVYSRYSRFCKEHGISMSKQVETFIRSQIEDDPEAREEYLKRLERIRKGRFVRVKSFAKEFGIKE